MKAQQGFTLIELMIVVAIIGILAMVALPAYNNYTKQAKFAEVVAQVGAAKTAIEICYQIEDDLSICNAGSKSIPAEVTTGTYDNLDTMTIAAGIITATGTAAVDSTTMIATPSVNSTTKALDWGVTGSCKTSGWCN